MAWLGPLGNVAVSVGLMLHIAPVESHSFLCPPPLSLPFAPLFLPFSHSASVWADTLQVIIAVVAGVTCLDVEPLSLN